MQNRSHLPPLEAAMLKRFIELVGRISKDPDNSREALGLCRLASFMALLPEHRTEIAAAIPAVSGGKQPRDVVASVSNWLTEQLRANSETDPRNFVESLVLATETMLSRRQPDGTWKPREREALRVITGTFLALIRWQRMETADRLWGLLLDYRPRDAEVVRGLERTARRLDPNA